MQYMPPKAAQYKQTRAASLLGQSSTCCFYLFRRLRFPVALQEVPLDHGAHDGQPFARLELRGEGQQPGVLDMEVFVHLQQHQQLRSFHMDRNTKRTLSKCFESTAVL